MKPLLFDQNLSPRLVHHLADVFPGSLHVSTVQLDTASDECIWQYAREHALIIVTKDADYSELGALRGIPPHIIWIRRGNCATRDIEALLRVNAAAIEELSASNVTGTLILA